MIVVNFSHPLTDAQRTTIEELAGAPIDRLIEVPVHFAQEEPFTPQVSALVGEVGLRTSEWQSARILINPPAFAPGAVALIAYLHGLMGDFPPLIRVRPTSGPSTDRYEVAEILDLQRGLRLVGRASRMTQGE